MNKEIESEERRKLIGRSGISKRASDRIFSKESRPKIFCECIHPDIAKTYMTRTIELHYCRNCSLLIRSANSKQE